MLRSPGEAFEHRGAFVLGDPGAVVVDDDLDPAREVIAESWTWVARPCLTALAMALSITSRSPVGGPASIRWATEVASRPGLIDARGVVGGAVEKLGDVEGNVVVGGA